MTKSVLPDSFMASAGAVPSTAHAVLSPQLRIDDVVSHCPSMELLRGSLRRRGVPLCERPKVDLGSGDLVVFSARVPGIDDAFLFAGTWTEAATVSAVRAAVVEWAAVTGPRRLLLASPRSFCAGVERAIEIVERVLQTRTTPVYVRKQIVHNTYVVADLMRSGAIFVDELDEVPDGATVVFSAHGVSPAVRREAAMRGLDVIDATCPLVTKVHSEAKRFAARGDTIVLIGHAGHEEVQGTMGVSPEHTVLVETPEDLATLEVPDPRRLSYLTQTTLAVDETAELVTALHARFPEINKPPTDDICFATTNRQQALKAVIDESDLVLVVGSANSSNSMRLVELSCRQGTPAHLVDTVADIRPEWLAGTQTVGLTAGASAPPVLVEQIVTALGGLGVLTVEERTVTRETIHFGLPSAVRIPIGG
jgi:4-hydroxy-3-methylbut-2-enyl diphosphate reductase